MGLAATAAVPGDQLNLVACKLASLLLVRVGMCRRDVSYRTKSTGQFGVISGSLNRNLLIFLTGIGAMYHAEPYECSRFYLVSGRQAEFFLAHNLAAVGRPPSLS